MEEYRARAVSLSCSVQTVNSILENSQSTSAIHLPMAEDVHNLNFKTPEVNQFNLQSPEYNAGGSGGLGSSLEGG